MLNNGVQNEANNLISIINDFWSNNVSNIQLSYITDTPFNMFTLLMKLYGEFDIKMEYDRSTLAVKTKIGDEYITLSQLAKEPIFKGFAGYEPENLLHNFTVLDNVLKTM